MIGLEVRVTHSPNLSERGIQGRVIWETANMLIIRTERGDKRVGKRHRLFLFRLPNGRPVIVYGNAIMGRPEERVKRV